jgi:hypothetical protein
MITRRDGQGCTHERADGDLLGAIQRELSVDSHAGHISHRNAGRVLG